jgi:radical SAM protein with 4Fe4S-binding SPASM domain
MAVFSGPFLVCLDLTSLCNLNCKHCLTSHVSATHDLTTDEILSIIAQIKALKVFKVVIFGREPLMRKDFFPILEALVKLKIEIHLNTNGILVTKAMAKKLSRYPIKKYIVSLDGSCGHVQDPLRGKGSFKKTIEGVRNLTTQKCRVVLSVTVTRFNYTDLKRIVLLGKELGADQVMFNELLFIGKAAGSYQDLCIPPEERIRLFYSLGDLKAAFGAFVSGPVFQIFQAVKEVDHAPKRKKIFPLKVKPCAAGVSKCAIRPDGWVTPCEMLWEVKAGNLREQSLSDIWHHSPVMQRFREGFQVEKKEVQECSNCVYAAICYKGPRCQPSYRLDNFKHKDFYCLRGGGPYYRRGKKRANKTDRIDFGEAKCQLSQM